LVKLRFLLPLLWVLPCVAAAQPAIRQDQPVYLEAGQMGYDQQNGLVIARNNVRVTQGQSILYADRLIYFQKQNVVQADGNVRVFDPVKRETYYASQVVLEDGMSAGVIEQFRIRMADNSQFAAARATRISETKTQLEKAVYSPCKICEGGFPFWQIKADEIEVDEEAEKIWYDDLTLEFFGIPVAYSPFFAHPTPDASRKSGFLKPEYSQSSNLGTSVKIPYYLNISPDKDATITPFFTSEEGLVMEGEYRQRTNEGSYQFNASLTNPNKRDDNGNQIDGREFRGYVHARGDDKLSEHWGYGFDISRATDDTYLRRYDYGNQKSLNSQLYLQGLYGRSYIRTRALAFQGLDETDDPALEPFVLPLVHGYYETDPIFGNARLFTSGNLQIITRDEGTKSRRASATSGVKLPVVTQGGHRIDSQLSLRTDLYSLEDQTLNNGRLYDGEQVRFVPQASVKWRYPLMRAFERSTLTLEPTVMAVAKPNGLNPDEIANEDNQIVEFNDSTLFDPNPFPGQDTVDEGSRVAYGLNGAWLANAGQQVGFLFGQSVSVDDSTPFPYNDEQGEHFSDYVGRLTFDYDPFRVGYRFRLDRKNLSPNNQTVSTSFNYRPVWLRVDYIALDDDQFLNDREEMLVAGNLAVTDEWSLNASARRDILNGSMTYASAGVVFQNECFGISTQFRRSFTRDRDVEPDTSITVRVAFKNINEL
jgi:LPS-assembly protein